MINKFSINRVLMQAAFLVFEIAWLLINQYAHLSPMLFWIVMLWIMFLSLGNMTAWLIFIWRWHDGFCPHCKKPWHIKSEYKGYKEIECECKTWWW